MKQFLDFFNSYEISVLVNILTILVYPLLTIFWLYRFRVNRIRFKKLEKNFSEYLAVLDRENQRLRNEVARLQERLKKLKMSKSKLR